MTSNSPSYYEMTSSELISGSGPGATPNRDPIIVHLTDFNRTYMEDQDAAEDDVTADNFFLIADATGRRWRRVDPGPTKHVLFDDFFGDVLEDRWNGASGSDGQALDPAINAAVGGTVRLVSGDVGNGDDAVDSSVLTHGLNWKANQNGLVAQFKLKLDTTIANTSIFVGLTDAAGTAEMPIEASGTADGLTSNASDACGLMYDTDMDTDEWGLVGVDGDSDITFESTGSAPVADTYNVIRIEVDTDGAMTVYLDGAQVGTAQTADSVDPTTVLTPVVAVMSRTTTSVTCDVDYLYCEQNR